MTELRAYNAHLLVLTAQTKTQEFDRERRSPANAAPVPHGRAA
ncbi:MAG TPA: hypothetical protein VN456_01215 [Desulfosporosinus sp.]|nr:hypothetical protein [Desulfosporosinus sp.]